MSITIRQFDQSDIDFAITQTSREGWDNTPPVFRVFLAQDPDGCFIAKLGGETAGMITTTCYERSAWIGNLIVTPPHRRKGIGRHLMEHAIGQIEVRGIRTISLEADPMGVRLYRRLGFVDQSESPRFIKQPPHALCPCPADRLAVADLDAVAAMDAAYFGDDRRRLMSELFCSSLAAYTVRNAENLVGFAMALPAARGIRLGPSMAETMPAAEKLVTAILAHFPNDNIITAASEDDGRMTQVLESKGFVRSSSCLRMIRGEVRVPSLPKGLITLADGALG